MNDELKLIREEISSIDEKMVALFSDRMSAVEKLAEYKKAHGMPILDLKQEEKIIKENEALLKNPELTPYYKSFITNIMTQSDKYQQRLNEGMKVAYNGEEGAFAHIAAKRIFPEGIHQAYSSFSEAYEAVEKGECDCAVIPIENSSAGEVGVVMDLVFEGNLNVTGSYTLPVTQNLLVKPGTKIDGIKTVISHSQALMQCEKYIESHGWETIKANSTSLSAKQVSESDRNDIASIASEEAANLYGLEILDHDINENHSNTTRFVVLSHGENILKGNKDRKFIMMFTVSHVAGALAKAINAIGDCGFNMVSLMSRPIKSKAWQYYFYAELEGDDQSENGQKMLQMLSEQCDFIKIAGRYTTDIDLGNSINFEIGE